MEEFTFDCGTTVFVTRDLIGFIDGHPSNVDYYYSKAGYGCKTPRQAAWQYHANFCQCRARNRLEHTDRDPRYHQVEGYPTE